jgi:hypothetical protein
MTYLPTNTWNPYPSNLPDSGWIPLPHITPVLPGTTTTLIPTKSDGLSTDYYKIPEGSKDLLDLIEHKEMNYSLAQIFKACYRLGHKQGNDDKYDLKKMLFFIVRLMRKAGIKVEAVVDGKEV